MALMPAVPIEFPLKYRHVRPVWCLGFQDFALIEFPRLGREKLKPVAWIHVRGARGRKISLSEVECGPTSPVRVYEAWGSGRNLKPTPRIQKKSNVEFSSASVPQSQDPKCAQTLPVLPVAIERESAVAPSSPTQLKLQLSVDRLLGIPLAIALIPASEMRLPPRARVTRDVEVMVLSATAAAPVSPAAMECSVLRKKCAQSKVCVYTCARVCGYVCVCMYVCMYVYVCVCVCVIMHMYVCDCACVCVCVWASGQNWNSQRTMR
jgi:hypothetical protein